MTPIKAQATAQRYIVSGVRLGLSGAQILNVLRQNGLGYRTQNFYQDLTAISSSLKYRRGLTAADIANVLPSQGFIQLSSLVKSSYVFPFSINIVDGQGNTIDTKVFSYSSKTPMSQDLAAAAFRQNHPQRNVRYKLDFSSIQYLDPIQYSPISS